jgi:hypothetical protein
MNLNFSMGWTLDMFWGLLVFPWSWSLTLNPKPTHSGKGGPITHLIGSFFHSRKRKEFFWETTKSSNFIGHNIFFCTLTYTHKPIPHPLCGLKSHLTLVNLLGARTRWGHIKLSWGLLSWGSSIHQPTEPLTKKGFHPLVPEQGEVTGERTHVQLRRGSSIHNSRWKWATGFIHS